MGSLSASGNAPRPITCARAVAATVAFLMLLGSASWRELAAQAPGITLSSTTPNLVISNAQAGSTPQPNADVSTRITIVADSSSTLFAALDAPLPTNLTLRVKVQAPVGAVSMGFVTLDSTPQAVVSGITAGNYPMLTVTYELVAMSAAGTISQSSCSVEFTLQAGS